MSWRLGIDVGGTFTDFVILAGDGSLAHAFKERSTPERPARAILSGLERFLREHGGTIGFLGHGSTVVTNMLIERKGARTAFVTTRGFADVLDLARQARPHLFDYRIRRAPPLVPARLRLELAERMDAAGTPLLEPPEAEIAALARRLDALGVASVAIGFLHACRNAAHEILVAERLRAHLPEVAITTSHATASQPREYERFATTAACAFVKPRCARYMDEIEAALARTGADVRPFTISSNGGLLDPAAVRANPVRIALSGPAAGVAGAARLARAHRIEEALTLDVGGTSSDIAVILGGRPRTTRLREVAGLPIAAPMIEMDVIGAGGGSLAMIDEGGALRLGPQSAGADPGPAAYGRGGTEPTLTDAAIVLGWLNREALLGGAMPIDAAAAVRAIEERLARPLEVPVATAAAGVVRLAATAMARAMRSACVRRGRDVRQFALLAYGGAGPLMAAAVAEVLQIRRVLIPASPGTFCAQAMLQSEIAIDLERTLLVEADDEGWCEVERALADLREEGRRWLEASVGTDAAARFGALILARYKGQSFELQVPLDDGGDCGHEAFLERFHAIHEAELGTRLAARAIEIVGVILRASHAPSSPGADRAPFSQAPRGEPGCRSGVRRAFMLDGHEPLDVPVRDRASLPCGTALDGPLIVEELTATSVVLPGWRLTRDEETLVMTRGEP